ncbi:MAG: Hsp70 family protein, partial [Terracidiphilus sp.]
VDALLRSAGLESREVDRVFLTGGTSFVPAVRRIFIDRFGLDRIRGGNEFTSVAQGLALSGAAGGG